MAMVSLVVVPVGLVGALRLARPGSPWARLYGERRRARAQERFPEPWLPARLAHRHRGEKPPVQPKPLAPR